MKEKALIRMLAIICFVLVLVEFPCPTQVQSQEQILPIGMIQPLTGPGAAWGQICLRCGEMALEDINQKGVMVKGVTYKFKIIAEDDKYFADVAVDRLKKLIDRDNVKIILGSLGSASTNAEAPICAGNRVLHLSTGFGKEAIEAGNDYTFLTTIMPEFVAYGYVDFLAKEIPNVHKIVFIYPDDATGQSNIRVFKPEIERKGWESKSEGFERGIIEFGPLCIKVAASKPDIAFFLGVTAGDARKIAKGLRDLGYKGALVHGGSFMLPDLYKLIGDSIGVIFDQGAIGEKPYANDEYVKIYSEYIKRYGKEAWGPLGLLYYGWIKIYAQAIKEAQSLDPTVIRDLLATPGKEWPHILGGKCYCITQQIAKEKGLGSNHYFNTAWQVSTWDNAAKKQVNADWLYPYGWPGGKLPK
jgi:branched-chain amino acid transport system substrate-binding protein